MRRRLPTLRARPAGQYSLPATGVAERSHVEVQNEVAPVRAVAPVLDVPSQITQLALEHASLGSAASAVIEPPTSAQIESLRFIHDLWAFVQVERPATPSPTTKAPALTAASTETVPAHDRRTEIIAALGAGPQSIQELAEQIGMADSTLRRWLRMLEADQIVRRAARNELRASSWELVN